LYSPGTFSIPLLYVRRRSRRPRLSPISAEGVDFGIGVCSARRPLHKENLYHVPLGLGEFVSLPGTGVAESSNRSQSEGALCIAYHVEPNP